LGPRRNHHEESEQSDHTQRKLQEIIFYDHSPHLTFSLKRDIDRPIFVLFFSLSKPRIASGPPELHKNKSLVHKSDDFSQT
jgi:hypothetical protein